MNFSDTYLKSKSSRLDEIIVAASGGKLPPEFRVEALGILQAAIIDRDSRRELFVALKLNRANRIYVSPLDESMSNQIFKNGISDLSDELILRLLLGPVAICELADEVANEFLEAWFEAFDDLTDFLSKEPARPSLPIESNPIWPYAQAASQQESEDDNVDSFDDSANQEDEDGKKKNDLGVVANKESTDRNASGFGVRAIAALAALLLIALTITFFVIQQNQSRLPIARGEKRIVCQAVISKSQGTKTSGSYQLKISGETSGFVYLFDIDDGELYSKKQLDLSRSQSVFWRGAFPQFGIWISTEIEVSDLESAVNAANHEAELERLEDFVNAQLGLDTVVFPIVLENSGESNAKPPS